MRERNDSQPGEARRPGSPRGDWRGGRLNSPDRRLVVLACAEVDASELKQAWSGQSIDIETCADLAMALLRVGQLEPDLVVVCAAGGVVGPGDFLRTIRLSGSEIPVVVGLATDDASSASAALSAGATAVFRLPFSPEALLRLLNSSAADESFQIKPLPIDLGRLRVDGAATRVWVDGIESLLPAMEHLLLRYLAERHRQIISREELMAVAWGEPNSVVSNSLAVHMARLRRRFQAGAGEDWIRSVRGYGYQMVVSTRVRTKYSAATT